MAEQLSQQMSETVPEPKFSLDDAMSASWKTFSGNFPTLLGLWALAGFLAFLPHVASAVCNLNADWWAFALFLSLLGFVLQIVVHVLGMMNVQIRLCRGQGAGSDDLWSCGGKFFAYFGASFIYAWVIFCGALMFIVPGIIFGIMFMFYPYFLAEHKLGPIQALKASAAITSGAMWELFFLLIILHIVKVLGFFAFVIGLIPTVMYAELTIAQAYKMLLDKTPAEKLPFKYVNVDPDMQPADGGFVWEESMGYDDPNPVEIESSAAVNDDGVRLETPPEDVQFDEVPVDNKAGENDKSGQEH